MKAPYNLYENGFGYIRLENLKLAKLPKTLLIENDEMIIKNEFHISLVWIGRLSAMVDQQNKDKIKKEMIEEFEKFTRQHSLSEYKLTKELRLVKKGDQKTIIAMAKLPNIDHFFKVLSKRYGLKLPIQPTHITLYTLPEDKIGIGILSEIELNKWSEPIQIPELQILL